MLVETIIDSLVQERKAQGLTQKDMAERLHCSTSFVQQFEYKRPGVTVATIERYATALNVEIKVGITHLD